MKFTFTDHANHPKNKETTSMPAAMEVAVEILRTIPETEIILTAEIISDPDAQVMVSLVSITSREGVEIASPLDEDGKITFKIGMREATRCDFSALNL